MLKVVVPEEYHEYINIFTWKDAKAVPPHREYDHTIKIENDGQPPYSPIYPLSGVKLKALWDYLEDIWGKDSFMHHNHQVVLQSSLRRK